MEKFCLLRHFYLPSPSRKCSALGPPSSAWREHLQWQRTPVIPRGRIWEETRARDTLGPQLMGTLTHGSARDPVVAPGTPQPCHQPALPPLATRPATGLSPLPGTWCGAAGGLGEHVVSEGRSDAVAVGIHGVVPVHVHVHVHGVQGDVTRVHGAVTRVQLCREGMWQPQLPSDLSHFLVPPSRATCDTVVP